METRTLTPHHAQLQFLRLADCVVRVFKKSCTSWFSFFWGGGGGGTDVPLLSRINNSQWAFSLTEWKWRWQLQLLQKVEERCPDLFIYFLDWVGFPGQGELSWKKNPFKDVTWYLILDTRQSVCVRVCVRCVCVCVSCCPYKLLIDQMCFGEKM